DPVADSHDLADFDLYRILIRLETPREPTGDVGVEAHLELAVEGVGRSSGRDLGGAAEAGRAAEPVVERHGRIGRAHHSCNKHSPRRRNHDIAASLRGYVRNVHRDYNGRFSTAGPFTRVTT